MIELIAEQLRAPTQFSDQLLGIGVEQQLVRIEAVAGVRLVGTVNAVAIDCARPHVGQITVPDLVGIFGQLDPFDLGLAGIVEQAKLDLGRIRGKQRKIDTKPVPGSAKRKRPAFGDLGFAQAERRASQCIVALWYLIHCAPLCRAKYVTKRKRLTWRIEVSSFLL